jgi:hypothetical protein
MVATADSSLAQENQDRYSRQLQELVSDTTYVGFFIFCALWTAFDNSFVGFSYVFGATLVSLC